jgi:hypothetical protein
MREIQYLNDRIGFSNSSIIHTNKKVKTNFIKKQNEISEQMATIPISYSYY